MRWPHFSHLRRPDTHGRYLNKVTDFDLGRDPSVATYRSPYIYGVAGHLYWPLQLAEMAPT